MSTLALRGGRPIFTGQWPKWPILDEREVERVVKVVRSGVWAWNGPQEQEFRKNFAAFLGSKHGLCVTNGTHALQLALEALDIGYGDEVIVPCMTWQATAACAIDVNAIPVLVDIEPDTLCIDPAAVRKAITPRTKAIIPVHLFSCVANMDEILAIGKEHKIHVIEDCSHQHGSEWRGKKVGSMGIIGAFSLQGSKVLNSGEGGFISTSDDRLWHRLDSLRNCGRHTWGGPEDNAEEYPQSGNFRFTEMQAALLNGQLSRLEAQTALRDQNAQYLNRVLAEVPGLKPMRRREQITRQQYYGYAFRYNAQAFGGLPIQRFREAMHAELGLTFGGIYEPLNKCSLYRPNTKRRHKLNDEYWSLINPSRFETPHATAAHQEIIVIGQTALLTSSREMEMIAEAALKVQKNAVELRDWTPQPVAVAASK
jgi:L-glutamine:2-deoxy-scyllo-inosose/3-amino-2,3-dideoxy-scyllo-inosose aminotransferase